MDSPLLIDPTLYYILFAIRICNQNLKKKRKKVVITFRVRVQSEDIVSRSPKHWVSMFQAISIDYFVIIDLVI